MARHAPLAAALGALSLVSLAAPAEAQTRVLVLADGSTTFGAVTYFNAAVAEFAAVVGAANVQGRNDLNAVTLTPADLRRAGGDSYDVVVLVASFNGIGSGNWALLREAVRTRAARSFVLFSDHCSLCSADNVDGGNGNGLLPLLNAATGWSSAIGMLRTAPLGVPLNTRSPLSASFAGMNPMQTNDYRSMNGIPADNALYLAPGATPPPPGPAPTADVAAFFLPTSQSFGGVGACVFGIADVNPLAIPGNPGRVGPAFIDAITSPTGSCALGPLVITGPSPDSTAADPRPIIRGQSQPGTTVTVTVGGQTLSAVVAPDGSWSVTPAPLAEGSFTATALRTIAGVTQTATVTFTVAFCGGGLVSGDERCDDGNAAAGDGCSPRCAVEPGFVCEGDRSRCRVACGDGVRAPTEACDDGNTGAGDGCSPACAVEPGFACENPDVGVFYSRRGLSDCVVVPDFEPVAVTPVVPASLAVAGVGVWRSYRARYVSGAVDFADRPTAFRAPTLLQFDPGTGPRAVMFGGLTRTGQTSPAGARAVAEMASLDFAVGVAGSVRAAVPDIPAACGNNSDTAITYRIDSMSACAPACRDTSPSEPDTGCVAPTPHCRPVGAGGGRCEVCVDTAMTGVDVGCSPASPHCVTPALGAARCVACQAAADCDDRDPCTVDGCAPDGTCARSPVPAGERGGCPMGLVCGGPPRAACVACVSDAQCGGPTPLCDVATGICRAAPDAAMDATVDAVSDAATEVGPDALSADAATPDALVADTASDALSADTASDALSADAAADALVADTAADALSADTASDALSADAATPDALVADTAADTASDALSADTASDSAAPSDGGLYRGGGCGCTVPGRAGDSRGGLVAAAVALLVARRRRRG